jgi:uncharacterized SAM-binding protein YcdF (DUF218 family)
MAPPPVIVIFGAAVRPDGSPSRTLRRRVEAAAVFARRFPAAFFLPTGAVGRHGPAEAAVMAALLESLGVPPGRIVQELTGTDTLSSVRAARAVIHARGWTGPVFAATSAYHMTRCVALMRIAGLRAWASTPPPFPAASGFRARWYWRLREAAALPYDCAIALWLRITGKF